MAETAEQSYPTQPRELPAKFREKIGNNHAKRSTVLSQIVQLQDAAFEIAKDPKVKETVRCFAMRSYCSLQEERRKLQMRPLPKPVDVSKLKHGKRKAKAEVGFEYPDANPVAQVLHDKPNSAQVPKL